MFKTPLYTYGTGLACENPYVAMLSKELLDAGGNAIDISVTISLGLAICIPHLGGIGGDFFAILLDMDSDEVSVVMGSGYSGKYVSIDSLMEHGYREMPTYGAASVTVPGLVDGLYRMWKNYGSLEWRTLVEPVIKMCRDGFPLSRTLKNGVSRYIGADHVSKEFKQIYGSILGVEVGGRVRMPGLARLLEEIAEDPRSFYEGPPMESFIETLNKDFQVFDPEDFRRYEASIAEPLVVDYKGARVYEMPLNSLGISTLQLLRLHDYRGENPEPNSIDRIAYYISLFEKIYAIRHRLLGDPRYMRHSVDELLDPGFIEEFSGEYASSADGDTTFFCVSDSKYVVGCIQSLFHPFGSMVVDTEYWVVFNNRGSSFTFDRECVNHLEPNKYPLHTLSTPLIKNDESIYVLGLSAGIYRPQLHLQLITNLLDYNMYPQEAIEYPRFIWEPESGEVRFESGFVGVSRQGWVSLPLGSRLGVGAILLRKDELVGVYPDIRGEMYPYGFIG